MPRCSGKPYSYGIDPCSQLCYNSLVTIFNDTTVRKLLSNKIIGANSEEKEFSMAVTVDIKALLEAGVHFGQNEPLAP